MIRSRALAALALGLALGASSGCARLVYNFGEIAPGRIYRSAQPSPLFLRYLLREHGIRSIVNLRGETEGFESAFAARNGLRLFALDLSATKPPKPEEIERFLAIVRDPSNQPVLVHCKNGVDRTGYMLGLYRMRSDGWTVEQAAREMNRFLQFEPINAVPQAVLRDSAAPEGAGETP